MNFLPGAPQGFANQTPTTRELIKYMVADIDMLPYTRQLFRDKQTPFSSFLADKGLVSKGLFEGFSSKNMKVTSSNVVQYAISHSKKRKGRFVAYDGVTFVCDAYPTQPGKNQMPIAIYLDTNWFSPNDQLELKDPKVTVWVADPKLPEQVTPGIWKYIVKVVTNTKDTYVDSTLFAEGNEIGFVMTMFEQDLSETAYEKYTFDGWGRAYMTVQRMKYSISGAAAAMKAGVKWTQHKGNITWIANADAEMMERWAGASEYQYLWGQGTVSIDGDVLLHNMENKEIMAGDGICNQGDGSLKIPYQKLTKSLLESVMQNLQLRAGGNGQVEAVLLCGQQLRWAFNNLMVEMGVQGCTDKAVEGSGASKGINNTYKYYEVLGVNITPIWYPWYDDKDRPLNIDANGVNVNSNAGIFVSLGKADNGDRGIETLQLRTPKIGTVSGIDKGGSNMANSVDGSHTHILSQSGIVLRNQEGICELYKR